MRIVLAGNEPGGMYRFRIDLIRELLKNNEVVILVPDGEFVEEMKAEGCKFIDTPIDRRGVNPLTDFKLLKNYKQILKSEKPDLVITYTIKPNIYCCSAAKSLNIKYDANITGLGTSIQKGGLIKYLVSFLYKGALNKANTVFFENVENKDYFVSEKIIDKSQAHVLNGAGVNINHYCYSEYPFESSSTRFLFIGRIMREKGIDELISAMRKLNKNGYSAKLDVVGFYEENYKEVIDSCVKEGWMTFYGRQQDVRPYIKNCHCFVLPSWHEGMANTNLECASMGRPVITTNIHGCLESVEEGKSGYLCEKQNPDSLYEKMKEFVELPYEKRKAMGAAGRKRMEELFDKRKVVQETIKNL